MQDASVLMECTACTTRTTLSLPGSKVDVFQPNLVLLRLCEQCARETVWQLASHAMPARHRPAARNRIVTPKAAPNPQTSEDRNRRRQRRSSMRTSACVRHDGSEEVVRVVDLSRTGIRFVSARQYGLGAWLRLAAPYLDGNSSIFLPGRIIWRKLVRAGLFEYGVQYAA